MQLGSSLRRRRSGRDPEEGEAPPLPPWLRVAGVVALVALGGLGLGYLVATRALFPPPPPPGDLFAVPDVRGMDLARAAAALDEAGLSLGAAEHFRHPTADSGSVVGQGPVPGQLAPPNTPVRVSLSLGPERQEVPDLLGLQGSWAVNVLEAAGFGVALDSVESDEPRGRVLALEPGAGTEMALPGEVVVRVSQGPAQVTMPTLTGMTEEAARDTVSALGLVVGRVQEVFRFGRDQGRVVEQAPPPGSQVERGAAIRISVGRRGGGAPGADTTGNKTPRRP